MDCYETRTEYSGAVIANSTGVTDANACQDLCKANNGCKYFAWHMAGDFSHSCHLMGSAAINGSRVNDNIISGPRHCYPSTTCQPCYAPLYYSYDYFAKGYASTAQACQLECQMEDKCFYWEWRMNGASGKNRCYMNGADAVNHAYPSKKTISGPKHC